MTKILTLMKYKKEKGIRLKLKCQLYHHFPFVNQPPHPLPGTAAPLEGPEQPIVPGTAAFLQGPQQSIQVPLAALCSRCLFVHNVGASRASLASVFCN